MTKKKQVKCKVPEHEDKYFHVSKLGMFGVALIPIGILGAIGIVKSLSYAPEEFWNPFFWGGVTIIGLLIGGLSIMSCVIFLLAND